MSRLVFGAVGFVLAAIVFITTSVLIAWTGPTSPPPNGNIAAPLNVGTTDQVKNAGLGINSLAVFGNAIINGTNRYLNFGTLPGDTGYGIRDSNGILEFKNLGDTAWRSATSTISNNAVSQIKFSDGTTQTTAGGGSGVPAGAVMAFNLPTCPTGWSALAGAVGRTIVGIGTYAANADADAANAAILYSLAGTGGNSDIILTTAQMPSHTHTFGLGSNTQTPTSPRAQGTSASGGTGTTGSTGSGFAIDNRMSYIALLYCQKN